MDSLSLLPQNQPPAPPPRTTSIQSNLSKLLHFARNNKTSHLSFHSKSFNLTKNKWTASSAASSTSAKSSSTTDGRAIITLPEECCNDDNFAEQSSSYANCSTTTESAQLRTSISRDSMLAKASTSSTNSPIVDLAEEGSSSSHTKNLLKKTGLMKKATPEEEPVRQPEAAGGPSVVAHRQKPSKQPRPKSDMFFVNPLSNTRPRPIGRSASRYSTLEVRAKEIV